MANYDVESVLEEILGGPGHAVLHRASVEKGLAALRVTAVPRYERFSLTIDHLPWQGEATWECYAVDHRRRLDLVERGETGDDGVLLEGEMECPSVQVWVLRAGSGR